MPRALIYFNEEGWKLQNFNEMILLSKTESEFIGSKYMHYSLGTNKNKAGLPCNCKGVKILAFDAEGLCSCFRIGYFDENGKL